jgi:hypothetical protein
MASESVFSVAYIFLNGCLKYQGKTLTFNQACNAPTALSASMNGAVNGDSYVVVCDPELVPHGHVGSPRPELIEQLKTQLYENQFNPDSTGQLWFDAEDDPTFDEARSAIQDFDPWNQAPISMSLPPFPGAEAHPLQARAHPAKAPSGWSATSSEDDGSARLSFPGIVDPHSMQQDGASGEDISIDDIDAMLIGRSVDFFGYFAARDQLSAIGFCHSVWSDVELEGVESTPSMLLAALFRAAARFPITGSVRCCCFFDTFCDVKQFSRSLDPTKPFLPSPFSLPPSPSTFLAGSFPAGVPIGTPFQAVLSARHPLKDIFTTLCSFVTSLSPSLPLSPPSKAPPTNDFLCQHPSALFQPNLKLVPETMTLLAFVAKAHVKPFQESILGLLLPLGILPFKQSKNPTLLFPPCGKLTLKQQMQLWLLGTFLEFPPSSLGHPPLNRAMKQVFTKPLSKLLLMPAKTSSWAKNSSISFDPFSPTPSNSIIEMRKQTLGISPNSKKNLKFSLQFMIYTKKNFKHAKHKPHTRRKLLLGEKGNLRENRTITALLGAFIHRQSIQHPQNPRLCLYTTEIHGRICQSAWLEQVADGKRLRHPTFILEHRHIKFRMNSIHCQITQIWQTLFLCLRSLLLRLVDRRFHPSRLSRLLRHKFNHHHLKMFLQFRILSLRHHRSGAFHRLE